MRYRVVAVGKLKHSFYQSGCDYYLKLLGALAQAELVEVRAPRGNSRSAGSGRSAGDALVDQAAGYVVTLDERGKGHDTLALAARISELELAGESRISVLIGGPDGHDDAARRAAAESWSLSKLTFSHELARLVLLEQLYRAEAVRAGHPYHRE